MESLELGPQLALDRHAVLESEPAVIRCTPGRAQSGAAGEARLLVVGSTGRVAHVCSLDTRGRRRTAEVTLPAWSLTPAAYRLVLLVGDGDGMAATVDWLAVVRDDWRDRYEVMSYGNIPVPITNHLGDLDRALRAYRQIGINYLLRTHWAREETKLLVDQRYRILPLYRSQADGFAVHGMRAEMEFDLARPPEQRIRCFDSPEAKERAMAAMRGRTNCASDEEALDLAWTTYAQLAAEYYDRAGVGRINVSHKPFSQRQWCDCDKCQTHFREFLKQRGIGPADLGNSSWDQVRLAKIDQARLDSTKMRRHMLAFGTQPLRPAGGGEILWVPGVPIQWLAAQAEDYRDLLHVGCELTPRGWVESCAFWGWSFRRKVLEMKRRCREITPDVAFAVELAHHSAEIGTDLATCGGHPWALTDAVDHMGMSTGISGPWLWHDAYFQCYTAAALKSAVGPGNTFSLTVHQDEIGCLGLETDSGHYIDMAPEEFTHWVFTSVAHGARSVGVDPCGSPYQIWEMHASCPSEHNMIGGAYAQLHRYLDHVGPILARRPAPPSRLGVLVGESRHLRKASADTLHGFKFLHRGLGGAEVDLVHEQEIVRGRLDDLDVLCIFGDGQCLNANLLEAVSEWVRRGGTLVADLYTGRWDRDFRDCDGLAKALGCEYGPENTHSHLLVSGEIVGLLPLAEYFQLPFEDRSIGKVTLARCDLVPGASAEVLAEWVVFDPGARSVEEIDGVTVARAAARAQRTPAVVRHPYGRGQAIALGFYFGQDLYFAEPAAQDALSRFLGGLLPVTARSPVAVSDHLDYHIGVRDGGPDLRYFIILPTISHWKWRPREEDIKYSRTETDPTRENQPQLIYNLKEEPLPARISLAGKAAVFDVVTGARIRTRLSGGRTVFSERMAQGETRMLAAAARVPARAVVKPARATVKAGTPAEVAVSFADARGARVRGAVPFRVRVANADGAPVPGLADFVCTDSDGKRVLTLPVSPGARSGPWHVEVEDTVWRTHGEATFRVRGASLRVPKLPARTTSSSPVEPVSAQASGAGATLSHSLASVRIAASPVRLEELELGSFRGTLKLAEGIHGELRDAFRTRIADAGSLRTARPLDVHIEESGPVRASVLLSEQLAQGGERPQLVRTWRVRSWLGWPGILVESQWHMPGGTVLLPEDWIDTPRLLGASGKVTSVRPFTEDVDSPSARQLFDSYRLIQAGERSPFRVEFPLNRYPPFARSHTWGQLPESKASFYLLPQQLWMDVSRRKSGLTLMARLVEATDSAGTRVSDFGTVGFGCAEGTLAGSRRECAFQWHGVEYPRLMESMKRRPVAWQEWRFQYQVVAHEGGAAKAGDVNPDGMPVGALPGLDVHRAATSPRVGGGLVAYDEGSGRWAVCEGLGIARRGHLLELSVPDPEGVREAVWHGQRLPVQVANGYLLVSLPEVHANEASPLELLRE